MRATKRVTLFWIIAILAILPGAIGSQSTNFLTETCRTNLGAAIESSPAGGDWPMFRHDAQHTGYVQTEPSEIYVGSNDLGIYALNAANCSKIWRFQTGGPVKSSPAVRIDPDGNSSRVYVGSDDGRLYALDASGVLVWSFSPPTQADVPALTVPGAFRSSPLLSLSQERIFIGNDDGLVYSVILGEERETIDLLRFPSVVSPEVTDSQGNVTQARMEFLFPKGSVRSSLVADNIDSLDTEDSSITPIVNFYFGTTSRFLETIEVDEDLLFNNIISGTGTVLDGPIFASPAVSREDTVYLPTASGTLFAIRPDFVEQWRSRLDGDVFASPAVASSGTIYLGSMNGTMYGIRPNGTIQCTFKVYGPDGRANSGDELFVGIRSSAAVTPDGLVVFGADDGYLYVIEDQTCRHRASFKTNGPIVSSPMVSEGENDRMKIYVGSGDGFFYILSLF